ncbi:MAG: hypothetical protein ACI9EW_002110 [Cellvibrionaceae bacterium]
MQLKKRLEKKTAFLIVSSLLACIITFLLYGRVVSIPFYSDDLLQIPWARTAPLDEIWGTLNPFDHFRPVQFSIWRLWQWVAGDLTPRPLRLFNLLLHAGSGCLTGYLAFRFTHHDWFAGLGSTVLFVLFPFSYDAILWISSAAYPLAVFLGLLSLHSWISSSQVNQPDSRGWLFASLACALASALSLESGILVGILLVITDILVLQRQSWRRVCMALSVSIIPFLIVNFLTPTPASPFNLTRVIQNGAMVAQATTFPFSSLFVFLADGLNSVLLLWLVGIIFLVAVLTIAYRSKKLFAPLIFALIWIILWGVIPAVTQTYTWNRDPPRAFYPCAVGIALLWGLLLSTGSGRPYKNYGYGVILGCALWLPISFNIQMAGYYQQAGTVLQQVLDSAVDADRIGFNLYVNLPERIGPSENEKSWLLGYEGVIPMPPPTDDVDLLLKVNGVVGRPAENKIDGAILAPSVHEIGLAGRPLTADYFTGRQLSTPLNIYTVEYFDDESRLLYLGQLGEQTEPAFDFAFDFLIDDSLALSVSNCSYASETATVQLTLHWFVTNEPVQENRSVFVHLWKDGEIVDQADGQFLAGLLPTDTLVPGRQLLTESRLLVSNSPPPYTIGIGLYNPLDGERSSVIDTTGHSVDDDYILLDCVGS